MRAWYAGNGNGLQGNLRMNGSGTMPMLGPDVQQLSVHVERITPDILHVKIGAPGRWEVPKTVFKAQNVTGITAAAMTLVILKLCSAMSPALSFLGSITQLPWPLMACAVAVAREYAISCKATWSLGDDMRTPQATVP